MRRRGRERLARAHRGRTAENSKHAHSISSLATRMVQQQQPSTGDGTIFDGTVNHIVRKRSARERRVARRRGWRGR